MLIMFIVAFGAGGLVMYLSLLVGNYSRENRGISNKDMLDLFVNWESIEQLEMYVREGFHPDIAKKALEIRMMKRVTKCT